MEGAIEFIAVGFRFLLAALFLVAGLSKLRKRQQFERAVRGYGLLPGRFAPAVASGLPPLEIAAGVLLALGAATTAVATVLLVLLGVFTLAVAVNLARGRQIDCGCFGAGIPRAITWATVARNVGLAAMAATVALAAPRALALDSLFLDGGTASHSDGFAALIASSAGLAVVALALETSRLRAVTRRTAQVTA